MLTNFPAILLVLSVVTGSIWLLDKLYLAPQRRANVSAGLGKSDANTTHLIDYDQALPDGANFDTTKRLQVRPAWIEYTAGFFPVLVAVFILRSFLFENFNVPSGSMMPTLLVGDYIVVNKFSYGIRLPVINKKIINLGDPQRGDVMVFRFPEDLTQDFVKRVVGVPGDRVVYKNKRLTINGRELSYQTQPDYLDDENLRPDTQLVENLNGVEHKVLQIDSSPPYVISPHDFPERKFCNYDAEGFACTVPSGQYFMMGDNRDNSSDSRIWGFVPDENIVGKAVMVWMNLRHPSHIGLIR